MRFFQKFNYGERHIKFAKEGQAGLGASHMGLWTPEAMPAAAGVQ